MKTVCVETEAPVHRTRPLLGTEVEISATGLPIRALDSAIHEAFAAVDKVQQLMSYHDPLSELSQLNHAAHRTPITVHPWTFAVLQTALKLSAESAGAFDVTIAPRLVSWGYLPRVPANGRDELLATWKDIELQSDRRIFFRRPLHMDLGGIAKGFAVDCAIEALQRRGVPSGMVSAGGDQRAFGERDWPIAGGSSGSFSSESQKTMLPRDTAVSTTASTYSRKRWRKCWVCPLVDGSTRLPCDDALTVSVQAPTALLADALTKIVLVQREASATLLQQYQARALLVNRDGHCQFVSAELPSRVA